MTYKLNPKLVAFLKKNTKTGELQARLTGSNGKNATLELDEGVSVAVKVADLELGVKLNGATGADLVFDAEGALIAHKVDEPPKTSSVSRGASGSARARQIPQF